MEWAGDDRFTVEGQHYRCMGRADPGELVILKSRPMIEGYVRLIEELEPQRIMEVGIFGGGNTALLAQIANPERVVACDLRSSCGPLDRLLDEGAFPAVTAHYGVDQADTAQLDALLKLFDAPLDLVVEDASHLEPQTRVTFDHLFPALRPGGVYVIEDWTWPHTGLWKDDPDYRGVTPPSVLIVELCLVAAYRPRMIESVTLEHGNAHVRRGPADLSPGRFHLADHLDPVALQMVAGMGEARTR